MRGRPGIGPVQLVVFAALLALPACDSDGGTAGVTSSEAAATTITSSPRRGPTVKPTETQDVDIVVARPKRINESTRCETIVTAADAGAVTGVAATLTHSESFLCYYDLRKSDGTIGGGLTVIFSGSAASVSASVTKLFGNTAVEDRQDERTCTVYVVVDGSKPLGSRYEALTVDASLRTGVDPCRVARELVERGFARLPDA